MKAPNARLFCPLEYRVMQSAASTGFRQHLDLRRSPPTAILCPRQRLTLAERTQTPFARWRRGSIGPGTRPLSFIWLVWATIWASRARPLSLGSSWSFHRGRATAMPSRWASRLNTPAVSVGVLTLSVVTLQGKTVSIRRTRSNSSPFTCPVTMRT